MNILDRLTASPHGVVSCVLNHRYAYLKRTSDEEEADEALPFTICMTLSVMALEDLPQLVLNCIYLDFTGFDDADDIAIFSFIMSLLSIFSNFAILAAEQQKARTGSANLWG